MAPERDDYGQPAARLIERLHGRGIRRMVALLRHSAREYANGRHDLDNPLTDAGREHAVRLGAALPPGVFVRAYASPPERCMESAERVLAAYAAAGGRVGRHRPVEGLGVFYALDQMRMWRAMTVTGEGGRNGMFNLLDTWFAGDTPQDMLIPADVAARLVLRLLAGKYELQDQTAQLDLCVSHDMTLFLVRNRWLGLAPAAFPVDYLDGVVFWRDDGGAAWVESDTGHQACVDALLD